MLRHSGLPLFLTIGAILLLLSCSRTSAVTIDCQPNGLVQPSQTIRKICDTLAVFLDSASQPESDLERRQMETRKRQDVDHVFLRFGRRFGNL